MKQYFAYTRVSTAKQGEHGVSLQEQKSEIERYAQQKGLPISEWFEERESAAKFGRAVFNDLMKRLRKGDAAGVIIHKIDRSARNLRDWVDIAQLTDDGIEVHFTREAVDMQSSSGRLSADVQAVVAANYVRNLREETIKGFYGRLKQGISPLPAPLGYLDAGRGKPKTIDPLRGPLIQEAFRLYAKGQYSQFALKEEMNRLGLRTRRGEPVSKNTLAWILSNPFYYGLLRIHKNRQTFAGIHEPLISKALFDRAQNVAAGRGPRPGSPTRRLFLFSRLVRCKACGRSLIGETQKGHIYYRCHSRPCRGASVREELVDSSVAKSLSRLKLEDKDLEELDFYAERKRSSGLSVQREQIASLELRLSEVSNRLNRLTDVYIDGHITTEMLNQRKEALLSERLDIEGQIRELRQDSTKAFARMEEFVELAKSAYLLYKTGLLEERRRIIEKALSNPQLEGKRLTLLLRSELFAIADRCGDPRAPRSRNFWEDWLDSLVGSKAS